MDDYQWSEKRNSTQEDQAEHSVCRCVCVCVCVSMCVSVCVSERAKGASHVNNRSQCESYLFSTCWSDSSAFATAADATSVVLRDEMSSCTVARGSPVRLGSRDSSVDNVELINALSV